MEREGRGTGETGEGGGGVRIPDDDVLVFLEDMRGEQYV